ncbi:glycine-rich RNA-binding, abscisic acid-inducible protein [Drosophila yakuba]|uniref:Uncharacterized protein n=1 Tax=Drosophila yakuba TaxID=7245 RepID=B4P7J5_DROYA|nr:glycine-rich RNA-binding, abscisic acid-inducible protein [Drosophila yakuba]EDW90030.1 uncharacterized protein Dyak_GE13042 [Drosophila yakuba]
MKVCLLIVFVFVLIISALLVIISGHPVEEQKVTLEDAAAQPGIDDGTGVRAVRHFGGGGFGGGGYGRGGFCCGGGGGFRRGGFGGGGFGGYPGGGYGGYPRGGGYGGGSASASASASASSSWGRK